MIPPPEARRNEWQDWIMCGDEFSPIELHEDGTANVVVGLCLLTSLDEMKKRARRIFEVDDIFTAANPRLIFENTAS